MRYVHETIAIACSDRATAIVAATDVASYVLPWDFTLFEVQGQLLAATSGGTFTVDVNDDGATVLSTKLTLDSGETSSLTAASSHVLKAATATTSRAKAITIAKGSKVSIDVDNAGSGSPKGLIVTLIGARHA